MEAFGTYLFRSVIWLSGFALVFLLFLKNERFFVLNRIYLIAGILTSFLFPFISIHYTVLLPAIENITTDTVISEGVRNTGQSIIPDSGQILFIVYSIGALMVAAILIHQNRAVIRTIKRSEIIKFNPVKLIRTASQPSSFSFFSYVFINPSITSPEAEEIMNHELGHIQQKHWFDLILVELLSVFQWFNPLVWIYVRFMKQNHEYLADEVALQRTSNPANYRATLLNQIVGSNVVSLSNSFNYSLNKKRFNMMKNIMSSPYRKLKILLILPVFAIILYAFAEPDYKSTEINQSLFNLLIPQEPISPKPITPQQPTSPKPLTPTTPTTPKTPPTPPNTPALPTPTIPTTPPTPLTPPTLPTPTTPPTPPTPPPPPPPGSLSSVLDIRSADGSEPLIIVDGIVTDIKANKIDPNTIKSINVLKGSSATEKYGDKGKNGVLEVTLIKEVSDSPSGQLSEVIVIGYGAKNSDLPQPGVKIRSNRFNYSGLPPLIIIDGVERNIDLTEQINPNDIESMTVLKNGSSTKLYGEKAKGGVIIITTKKKLNLF